jgi:membrane fusion protein, multidrug efflux system
MVTDQGLINSDQANLDYTTLRAPFDGVTGILQIQIGNLIQPTNTTGIVVLTQAQPISVVFILPNADIASVQEAMARGPVQATVYDQSGTKELDVGTLLAINNQAAPTSGTVQLKAIFPNQQRQLWPGTFVNVDLTTSVVHDALTVPTNALQQNNKGQFVFVVGADNRVAIRPVEVAQRLHMAALISKGLQAGETVVVQGQYRLTPGTLVAAAKPSEAPNPSTASAGMLP